MSKTFKIINSDKRFAFLKELLCNEGFKASFTKDMLITGLFCIIGFAVNIYSLIKSVKRVKNVN